MGCISVWTSCCMRMPRAYTMAPGAQNLAVVRRAALAVLKADTSFKASLPRRVRQDAHDDTYRTHLLTLVIS
ncbi:hypothetical protein BHS04_16215 [Myxococcus xanthus]|nr:hypothetical protein BHS04_16215 [Myxococcus xanthus]